MRNAEQTFVEKLRRYKISTVKTADILENSFHVSSRIENIKSHYPSTTNNKQSSWHPNQNTGKTAYHKQKHESVFSIIAREEKLEDTIGPIDKREILKVYNFLMHVHKHCLEENVEKEKIIDEINLSLNSIFNACHLHSVSHAMTKLYTTNGEAMDYFLQNSSQGLKKSIILAMSLNEQFAESIIITDFNIVKQILLEAKFEKFDPKMPFCLITTFLNFIKTHNISIPFTEKLKISQSYLQLCSLFNINKNDEEQTETIKKEDVKSFNETQKQSSVNINEQIAQKYQAMLSEPFEKQNYTQEEAALKFEAALLYIQEEYLYKTILNVYHLYPKNFFTVLNKTQISNYLQTILYMDSFVLINYVQENSQKISEILQDKSILQINPKGVSRLLGGVAEFVESKEIFCKTEEEKTLVKNFKLIYQNYIKSKIETLKKHGLDKVDKKELYKQLELAKNEQNKELEQKILSEISIKEEVDILLGCFAEIDPQNLGTILCDDFLSPEDLVSLMASVDESTLSKVLNRIGHVNSLKMSLLMDKIYEGDKTKEKEMFKKAIRALDEHNLQVYLEHLRKNMDKRKDKFSMISEEQAAKMVRKMTPEQIKKTLEKGGQKAKAIQRQLSNADRQMQKGTSAYKSVASDPMNKQMEQEREDANAGFFSSTGFEKSSMGKTKETQTVKHDETHKKEEQLKEANKEESKKTQAQEQLKQQAKLEEKSKHEEVKVAEKIRDFIEDATHALQVASGDYTISRSETVKILFKKSINPQQANLGEIESIAKEIKAQRDEQISRSRSLKF